MVKGETKEQATRTHKHVNTQTQFAMNFDAIIFQYLTTVERQLQENKPAEVAATLQRLQVEGYSEKEAKHLIAQCVAIEMHEVMASDTPYSEERYVAMLRQLPTEPRTETK